MSQIGFVGLGHMGLPMAINLVKAGHQVCGFDLNPDAVEQLVQAGGQAATNIADVAADKDVLITMLQQGKQVLQVCNSEDGLLRFAKAKALIIDCSTIDVASARALHTLAISKQLEVVDAPVSGGVAGAAAASLTFMVGGTLQAYNQALPLLSNMGKKIIHTGAAGSGQAAKICNNLILGISMVAISEAFTLAQALGLAPEKLFEVVTNASGQCWAMSKYVPVGGILENVPANNDYQPGFAAAMMLKDLVLGQQAAQTSELHLPLEKLTTSLYQQFIDQGHGNLDFSAIIQLIQQYREDPNA